MEWVLGLSSWIIQDGNYGDIATGDRLDAAVEFGFEDAFELTEATSPSASHEAGSVYDVAGAVVLLEPDVWVVDVGILAFKEEAPPRGLAASDRVSGKMWIGVDPFFYFERLGQRPSIPPLIYAWNVLEILRQTAPYIPAGPRLLVRDASKLGWETIERTNAWSDDDGRADYILRCELLPEPPRRSRV